MKILKKLMNINLTQFVPTIIIIALIATSIAAYQAPELITAPVTQQKKVSAKSTEEKKKEDTKISVGNLDLSKVKDGTYEGSGTGFRGAVKVSVTVKSHKITAIDVLSYADDSSFFGRAKSGVVSGILSKQSLNVDTVSGATYSSKGILAAVKNALTGEVDNSKAAGSDTASKGKAKKLATVSDKNASYKDGTYKGSGKGFGGTTTVSVTIKNGKISAIKVVSHHDTPSYFNRAKSKVISAIKKKQTTNVDTVSGATYSSNGIIKAVRSALSKAKTGKKSSDKTEDQDVEEDTGDNDTTGDDTGTDESDTSEEQEEEDPTVQTFTTTVTVKHDDAWDFDNYDIDVKAKVKDGVITAITVDASKTDSINKSYTKEAASKITPKLVALNNGSASGVDTVSGATCSSNAILEAYAKLLEMIK